MQYIYLHGFASSPQSNKAQYLSNRFEEKEIALQVLDLNQNNFTNLTLTRQINQTVTNFRGSDTPITLIGSSFGGLTSVWVAEKLLQVERLVLLAPAFNFTSYWRNQLREKQMQQWKKSGFISVYHYGEDKLLPLGYHFYEDLARYNCALLQREIPTLIIHGRADETIPIQASIDYAKQRPHVQLMSLDSKHSLGDKMEIVWQEIKRFCFLRWG